MNLSFYSFLGEKNIGGLRRTLSATKKHDEQAFGPVPKTFDVGENRAAAEKIRGVNKKELGANIWSAAQFTIHKSQQKRPERPDLELTQIGRGNMSHFLKWKY